MHSVAYQLVIFIIANANICFVAFCTIFFVSTRICNANNSFEFRMSWNRKLVILDSGNCRFHFVVRHSYCCYCCGVCVPFFWQMAGSPLSQSILMQVHNIRRANIQQEWERVVPFLLARMSCIIVMHVCVHLQRVTEWVNVYMSMSLSHSVALFLFLVFQNTSMIARI